MILVVDVSGSMHATDVKPTRLGAAQEAVRTFLKHVPKRVRVGLIAFSSEPQVAAPPTTDRELVLQSLDELGFFQGYGGTAIGDALAAAVELGKKTVRDRSGPADDRLHRRDARTRSSRSSSSRTGSRRAALLQPLQGAERAKAAGIPVYTVALGTPNGVLDHALRRFGGGGTGDGESPCHRIPRR